MNSKPLKVLFAEDDKDDRFFFEKVLKEIPITTQLTTVADGENLMDYLSDLVSIKKKSSLPDVIFLDLSMPRKTGFECLIELKQNEKLKDIPVVIFSTSYTKDINYEMGMINMLHRMGANHFIRKPNNLIELKRLVQEVLIKLTGKTIN